MTETHHPQGPTPPSPVPPPSYGGQNKFFQWIRNLRWARADQRWIAGVCQSIAARTGWDVALVRGIVIVLTILFWFPVILYGAAWLLLPDARTGTIELEELFNGRLNGTQVAAGIILFIGIFNPGPYFILANAPWYLIFGFLALAGVALAILIGGQNQPASTIPHPIPPTSTPAKEGFPMSAPGPIPPQNPYNSQGHHAPRPPVPPQGFQPARPQPTPYHYAPPQRPMPVPPQQPLAPQPLAPQPKTMSSVVGLLVLGGLMILGAGFMFIAVVSSNTFFPTEVLVSLGAAIGLLLFGLTLAVAALRGQRGGWFLGISIVAAMILFPLGLAAASSSHYYYSSSSVTETVENFVNEAPWGENFPFIDEDYMGQDGQAHSTIGSFDYADSEITAESSMITLDLTEAPADIAKDINLYASSSMVTIQVRPDQALAINADGYSSKLRTRGHGSSLSWFPKHSENDFNVQGQSPNFRQDQEGINLTMTLNSSYAVIVVTHDVPAVPPVPVTPAPQVTPSPSPSSPSSSDSTQSGDAAAINFTQQLALV